MSKIDISTLSREYELYYDQFLKTFSKEQSTRILSDLFICSTISNIENINKESLSNLFSYINKKYKKILFTKKEILIENLNIIEKIYQKINYLANNSNLSDFEKILGSVLEKHINRKKTGSYYTPEDTTNFICWNSIIISIFNKMSNDSLALVYESINISNNVEFIDKKLTFEEKINILSKNITSTQIDEIVKIIEKLKIIDPMCGSGAFIISTYECLKYLNQKLLNNKLDFKYYYLHLYGVDISNEAIILCKTRLILKSIIDRTYSTYLNQVLDNNILCNDALTGPDNIIDSNNNGLDWTKLDRFDCIIGNPPYVEVRDKFPYQHFVSKKCGNLYAYAIERSCNISLNKSVISFIVPLSLIATNRMKLIRECLENKSSIIYYCSFADRPGCLFSGVHQRLTIFFASIGENECRKFTSSYCFWYKDERKNLFKSLDFIENNNSALPKIGNSIENSIYVKDKICSSSLFEMKDDDGQFPLYVSSRIGFWAKAFIDKPNTNEIFKISFNSDIKRRISYCFINSSFFYFMWILSSDCWHVTSQDLKNIRLNYEKFSEQQISKLYKLSNDLIIDLEKNKVRINTKQTEFEYKHKYSKKIIDKIDDIICPNIGLDEEETKFIKAYTSKYRLNKIEESEE